MARKSKYAPGTLLQYSAMLNFVIKNVNYVENFVVAITLV